MPVKINYNSTSFKKNSSNLVLFTDDKFNLIPIKKYISKFEFSYVNDLLKASDLKKNLFIFELSSKKKNHFGFNKKKLQVLRNRKFGC